MSKIEDSVCDKIQQRAEVGKNKYGVTMERGDLSIVEWMIHLQEELMDAAVYLERLIELQNITNELSWNQLVAENRKLRKIILEDRHAEDNIDEFLDSIEWEEDHNKWLLWQCAKTYGSPPNQKPPCGQWNIKKVKLTNGETNVLNSVKQFRCRCNNNKNNLYRGIVPHSLHPSFVKVYDTRKQAEKARLELMQGEQE